MAVQRRVVYQVPVERSLIQPLGIDGVVHWSAERGNIVGALEPSSTLLSLASADGPEPAAMIAVESVGGRTVVNQSN